MQRKLLMLYFNYFFYLCLRKDKSNSNKRMQIKGLYLAFNHQLFCRDRKKTGNDLVTVLCPKEVVFCLFLSFLTCFSLIESIVNQSVCFDLLKVAFG